MQVSRGGAFACLASSNLLQEQSDDDLSPVNRHSFLGGDDECGPCAVHDVRAGGDKGDLRQKVSEVVEESVRASEGSESLGRGSVRPKILGEGRCIWFLLSHASCVGKV